MHGLDGNADFLIGFALSVGADFDGHFLVKPFEEVKQLVRGEPAEMSVHQVRHLSLSNVEKRSNFSLSQVFPL